MTNYPQENISKYIQVETETAVRKSKMPHHGENVKHFRLSRGFSQEYLAGEVGISQVMLCRLEKKELIPDDILESIAEVLGLDLIWLKDIPLTLTVNSVSLDARGNYFRNGGHATTNYEIRYPIENVIESLSRSSEILENNYKEILAEKDKIIAQKDQIIRSLEESREVLFSKLSSMVMEKLDGKS